MANQVSKQFKALAQRAKETLATIRHPSHVIIQVGSATCENAAGSRQVYSEFQKHIASSGRDDIILRHTGCTGRCSREPIVSVFSPGRAPIKYELVNRDLVHQIFTQHVLGNEPLLDHVLDGPMTTLYRYELLYCTSQRCGWDEKKSPGEVLRDRLAARGWARKPYASIRRVVSGPAGPSILATARISSFGPTKSFIASVARPTWIRSSTNT